MAHENLASALALFIGKHYDDMSPYAWKLSDVAWSKLNADFDHTAFSDDLPKQNIALKHHLSKRWATANADEKMRLAQWIVKDWGGIKRNKKEKILRYVDRADAERPMTPFEGVSSYSKILAIKDPMRYAIFDARVAVSLNAIQLLLLKAGLLGPPNLLAFPTPWGQNARMQRFWTAAFPSGMTNLAFERLGEDETYSTYLYVLRQISQQTAKTILELEMFLFAQADDLGNRGFLILTGGR